MRWLDEVWRSGIAPDPVLSVADWADRHRMLPSVAAEPGPWRTDRTPYLRGIMEALSAASPVERVVFMKGAQIGATEAGLNWLGYVIHHVPGVMLYVMPTTESARRTVRMRVDPLIAASPALEERVTRPRSRDPGNSTFLKTFPGGQIAFTGANSAVGLRSMAARYLFLDEVDGFPHDADGEGDPIALAEQRTVSFRGRKKIYLVSTPTLEGLSRIAKAFEESDQRRYHLPCPHCGVFQALRWPQVQWPDGDRGRAFYTCEACGEAIEERHKPAMLLAGEWRASAAGDGRTAGFHLSTLYSPFESWAEIAEEHGLVWRDPARLQVWVNTKLGETWQDRAAAVPEPLRLMARGESWGERVPASVRVLTAGIDVQQDRLEVEVVGWGKGEESWSLEYHVLVGPPSDGVVWQKLDALLLEKRRAAGGGLLPIAAACVDSGNWTQTVYGFTTPRHGRQVWAIKGRAGQGIPLWPKRPARPQPGRPPLYVIGVDAGKELTFARLTLERPGPGYMHLSADRDLDWYEQLVAERPVRRYVKGVPVREWTKASHARNEAFDCRIYAMAALHGLKAWGLDLERDDRQMTLFEAAPRPARPAVIRSRWLEGRDG